MTDPAAVVALVLAVVLAALGFYFGANVERVREATLRRNEPLRSWPIIGRIAYDFVRTPGYAVQLRIVAVLLLVISTLLVVLMIRAAFV